MISLDKEYNQIVNLVKFNVNFSKYLDGNDPLSQSPDYIIEKYYHWIGFTPMVKEEALDGTRIFAWTEFFNKYCKVWRPYAKNIDNKFKNILMYLYSTQNLQVITMSEKFEEYIGTMSMISDEPNKRGLHPLNDKFVDEILEGNKKNIKVVLRNMKIDNLMR